MNELERFLNGEEPEEEQANEATESEETQATDETEETESEAETESQEAETETSEETDETKDETSSSEDAKKEEASDHVPVRALQDERRKRQELQERLDRLEQQSKREEPKQDFWDDPEGWQKRQAEQTEQRIRDAELNMSERFARQRFDDIDDKFETFKELVQDDPGLYQRVMQSQSPWEAMAEHVDRHERFKKFEDADSYIREREADFDKRVEERAKELAEQRANERDEKRKRLPGSAADARQAAGRTASDSDADATPPSLDSILQS